MEYSLEGSKRSGDGKILDRNKIHAVEDELMGQYDDIESYHEILYDKFVDFVENKKMLDSFVESCMEQLEPVAKYCLFIFGGLIISCFELSMFKNRMPGDDKEDEMIRYVKDFFEKGKSLISDLDLAFEDKKLKKEYVDFIRQDNLLPESEAEPVHEDIYHVLARYSTKQPVLRDYIANMVFISPLDCTKMSKIFLFIYLYFIIDFLNEYYFD
jgi:hypothetical protein